MARWLDDLIGKIFRVNGTEYAQVGAVDFISSAGSEINGNLVEGSAGEPSTLELTIGPGGSRMAYGGELTIASGVITIPSPGFYTLDTEADAATDELHTILGGEDGAMIMLRSATASRLTYLRRYNGSGVPAGANILTADYTQIEDSAVGVLMIFDARHLSGAGAWIPIAPRGDYVTAYRVARRFQLGVISDPQRGTAAAGGGTLTESYTLAVGKVYDFTWHVHGRQESTGYAFMAMGRATAARSPYLGGGDAFIWQDDAGSSTAVPVQKCLVNPADGTDTGNAGDIDVTVDTSGSSFRVTVTNNDATNDLAMAGAGIAIAAHVYDLEATP